MQVQDLNGLTAGSAIFSKGQQIGRVQEIGRQDSGKLIAELLVANDFLVPFGSELRIVTDIDNAAAYLDIQVSHSKRYYSKGDTVAAFGTILLNKDVILEEVEVDPESVEEGIRHLLK